MMNIFKSRKFWLMILDVVISVASYFVTNYLAPDMAKTVLYLIGALQPVFVSVIVGIAVEDAATKRAGIGAGQADKE